MSTAEADDHKR